MRKASLGASGKGQEEQTCESACGILFYTDEFLWGYKICISLKFIKPVTTSHELQTCARDGQKLYCCYLLNVIRCFII